MTTFTRYMYYMCIVRRNDSLNIVNTWIVPNNKTVLPFIYNLILIKSEDF